MRTVLPTDRAALLDETRALKMARSVHAYVRGSTRDFYAWLAELPATKTIPDGPPIWICGDCHLGNLGPLADDASGVAFQIRDLDQTVIGNPAHDLIRLALSLETAARSSELPGVTIAEMIENMVEGYSQALGGDADGEAAVEPEAVRTVKRRALGRSWRDLAEERTGDAQPTIPLGKTFWPLSPEEHDAIDALFADERIDARARELAGLGGKARLRVIDAAYWKKGCSSLGALRYAVLLGTRERKGGQEYYALVDIKEAVASVVPVAKHAKMPADEAERVQAGACALSPNLGNRMIAAHLLGRPVVLRELAPQDLKLEVEQFSRREAIRAARYLAYVVGIAHARQLDEAARHAWRKKIRRSDGDLQAPSWLWSSVTELAGTHETQYLEHCRRYALASQRTA